MATLFTGKDSRRLEINPMEKIIGNVDKYMGEVSKRFLEYAVQIGEDEHIWIQMAGDGKQDINCYVVSDVKNGLCVDDLNWVFRDSAVIADGTCGSQIRIKKDLTALVFKQDPDHVSYWDSNSDRYYDELLDELISSGVLIQISPEGILLGVRGKVTVKLCTLFKLACPGIVVRPLSAIDLMDDLPSECILDFLNSILYKLAVRKDKHGPDDPVAVQECEPESVLNEDPGDCILIEDLDFSVRTYNCLKRAAINYAEQLSRMSDDELMKIRNLGKRSFNEIKEKMRELNAEQGAGSAVMLDELVGLEDIKAQVKRITAFARMKKDLSERGEDRLSMALNMAFMGNPGTAKTTVARIMAKTLNEVGLLPGKDIVEVGRADLVAEYTGQTAVKVQNVFKRARGKVLFIDEAYSVLDMWENAYGDEAISTIVQEMENNRDKTVVILAGYPDKMAEFMSRNPGLRSRVPFTFEFKDYSAEEMVQIACIEAERRGFTIDHSAYDKVLSLCSLAAGIPESGNGRFCRNLIENAILSYAERVYGSDSSVDGNAVLMAEDLEAPDTLKKTAAKSVRRIGFAA